VHQKITLENGLRILTTCMPQTRSVGMGIFTGIGSRYEAKAQSGISHFIEHMLFKGTERRPTAQQISEEIEGLGGVLNAETDTEATTFWAKVGDKHLPIALDVLLDMFQHSRFDPQEVVKERQVIIQEIGRMMDMPESWVHSLIAQLGAWKPQPKPAFLPADDSPGGPRFRIEFKQTEQAHLCVGMRGLSLHDPDRYRLRILNVVLGEGMSSRLFLEIREKRGLAYSVGSYTTHLRDTGSVVLYAGVPPKKAPDVVSAMMEQLRLLCENPVPAAELTKAKEFIKGRTLLRMEDTFANADWVGGQEVSDREVLSVDQVIERIDAVTTEDVQRIARQLFTTNRLSLAVVGPFKTRRAFMSRLAL